MLVYWRVYFPASMSSIFPFTLHPCEWHVASVAQGAQLVAFAQCLAHLSAQPMLGDEEFAPQIVSQTWAHLKNFEDMNFNITKPKNIDPSSYLWQWVQQKKIFRKIKYSHWKRFRKSGQFQREATSHWPISVNFFRIQSTLKMRGCVWACVKCQSKDEIEKSIGFSIEIHLFIKHDHFTILPLEYL